MHTYLALLFSVHVVSSGCALTPRGGAAPNGSSLEDLRAQHETERARLDAVRAEIARSELAARQAAEQASSERCRASVAQIEAEAKIQVTQCLARLAEFNACESQNAAHSSTGAVAGCVAGIGLAVVTGGAAAPLALGGCATGLVAGHVTKNGCLAPGCEVDGAVLRGRVLAEHHLTEWPACGGYAGLTLANVPLTSSSGVLVTDVIPSSSAHEMGIQRGDFIVSVAGAPTADLMALGRVLDKLDLGDFLDVGLVRKGRMVIMRGAVRSRPPLSGVYSPRGAGPKPFLGVVGEPSHGVPCIAGVVVTAVDSNGPAATAGIRPTDLIAMPDGRQFPTVDELTMAIRGGAPGQSVPMVIYRAGTPSAVSLVLGPRAGRGGL